MARVVLQHLYKTFPGAKGEEVVAVRDANLIIEDKEFLVLVGPSGCGKSTTLRMIAGLEEISKGVIAIDDHVVNDVAPKDRDIAMVFQNYALYPHMTVYENMAFGLKLRKFPKPEIDQRVRETAEILGLTPFLDRLPKALSGGQRQRVAVGRAIVRKPKVFLFDEPLSNLDAQMRVQMRAEISKLHLRLAATMIYVTHDQVEAMTMGDRIAMMQDGVIQQVADPITLYRQPANLFVAGFIGSPPMNFFHGTLTRHDHGLSFETTPGGMEPARDVISVGVQDAHAAKLAGHIGKPVVFGIRPENISVASAATASALRPMVRATIEVVQPMGWETYLHFSTGSQAFVARVSICARMVVNEEVPLAFDMSQAHFFDPATEAALI